MSDLDAQLRERLQVLYPAADPSGVADLVTSRVTAGDTGTPPPRGPVGGGGSWMPWIVGAIVVGVIAGAGAYFAMPSSPEPSGDPSIASLVAAADGSACPGSAPVTSIPAGSRVLAVARTEDGQWVSIRDVSAAPSTVWIERALLSAEGTLDSLPVDGCVTATVDDGRGFDPQLPTPTADPVAPTPRSGSTDSTPPVFQSVSVSYSFGSFVCSENAASTATISAAVTDDTGVASVTASFSGAASGSGALEPAWSLIYRPAGLSVTGDIAVTLTATDSAGNSTTTSTTVRRDQCPG